MSQINNGNTPGNNTGLKNLNFSNKAVEDRQGFGADNSVFSFDATSQSFMETDILFETFTRKLMQPKKSEQVTPQIDNTTHGYTELNDQVSQKIAEAINLQKNDDSAGLFQTEVLNTSQDYSVNLEKAIQLTSFNDIELLDKFGNDSVNNILFNYQIPDIVKLMAEEGQAK